MPGGNKNIKPEDGKQFSKDYQPDESWTEKKALELGNQLLDWQKEVDKEGNDKGHIFWEEFFVIKNDYYPELPSYLSIKFSSFLKLLERAKKIQEMKLVKYGVADRLNASLTKFCLTNHHGYRDSQHIDHTTQGQAVNDIHITVADEATINKVKKLMNGDKPDKDI